MYGPSTAEYLPLIWETSGTICFALLKVLEKCLRWRVAVEKIVRTLVDQWRANDHTPPHVHNRCSPNIDIQYHELKRLYDTQTPAHTPGNKCCYNTYINYRLWSKERLSFASCIPIYWVRYVSASSSLKWARAAKSTMECIHNKWQAGQQSNVFNLTHFC